MRTKSMKYSRRRENLAGYAFVGPALVCYLLLVAFPFCLTIILSFTEFNFLRVRDISQLGKYIEWIGLENFVKAFSDRRFVASISNTFVYAIATVPPPYCWASPWPTPSTARSSARRAFAWRSLSPTFLP